jgi:hypothetical protein
VPLLIRVPSAAVMCVGCGCTDDRACVGGCSWVRDEPPICSVCWAEFEPIFAHGPLPLDGLAIPEGRASRVADALLAMMGVDR